MLFRHRFLDVFLDAIFSILGRKWSPKGSNFIPGNHLLAPKGLPKTIQKRICDATSIFQGFGIDFGCQFNDILKVWAPKNYVFDINSIRISKSVHIRLPIPRFLLFECQHRKFLPASRIESATAPKKSAAHTRIALSEMAESLGVRR